MKKSGRTRGLVGLSGHICAPAHGGIEYQFRIIRGLSGNRWLVQLSSFWNGRPAGVKAFTEDYLLGEDVHLYASEQEMTDTYVQAVQNRGQQRLRVV
jgi:hypothetical protein